MEQQQQEEERTMRLSDLVALWAPKRQTHTFNNPARAKAAHALVQQRACMLGLRQQLHIVAGTSKNVVVRDGQGTVPWS